MPKEENVTASPCEQCQLVRRIRKIYPSSARLYVGSVASTFVIHTRVPMTAGVNQADVESMESTITY